VNKDLLKDEITYCHESSCTELPTVICFIILFFLDEFLVSLHIVYFKLTAGFEQEPGSG
jgi:hypothetical protein